jgi:hypothetical protein
MQPFPPRHLATRKSRLDLTRNRDFMAQSLILLSVVLIVGMVLANLPDHTGSGSAHQGASDPGGGSPGPTTFGNPIGNWSFEQNLAGWQVLGPADGSSEPQGRTSGSCASVRARGPQPARVGLAQYGVVRGAAKGSRYVAKAWVRSTGPGLKVTLRLVGTGARPDSSQAVTTTLPGMVWRAVIVDHTVTAPTDLGVEITADGVAAGDALLVDEVIVRQG